MSNRKPDSIIATDANLLEEQACQISSQVKSSQVAFNMIVASALSYKRNTKYCAIQRKCP